MAVRDARIYLKTGLMPVAGGADDQPAERLSGMMFAMRARDYYEVRANSEDWAKDLKPYADLQAVLYGDEQITDG